MQHIENICPGDAVPYCNVTKLLNWTKPIGPNLGTPQLRYRHSVNHVVMALDMATWRPQVFITLNATKPHP